MSSPGNLPVDCYWFYDYARSKEEWHSIVELKSTYSIDYSIGEAAYLKHRLGKATV